MRLAFFFDQSRCMGCNTCTVACKDFYNVNPGAIRYRTQDTHEADDGIGGFYSFVMSCNHCKSPACVGACSFQAITQRPDGVVVVDRNKCQDQRACITACPFSAPGIADDKQEPEYKSTWKVRHPMQKCNMCAELMDKGEQPVCVRACPAHAIEVDDYNVLLAKHPEAEPLTLSKYPYAYSNNQDDATEPSMLIKPRKKLEISGNYK